MSDCLWKLSLVCCVIALGCAQYEQTTRIVDGRIQHGRPVSAEAYSHYTEAALLEARGQLKQALDVFMDAAALDRRSADPATRIARIHCTLGDSVAAERWFEIASDREQDYAPGWRERAVCALRQGRPQRAGAFARRAFELAPMDVENSIAWSDVLAATGKRTQAHRLLTAYLALYPNNPRARKAALHLALTATASSPSRPRRLEFQREGKRRHSVATLTTNAAEQAPVTAASVISLVRQGSRVQATRDAALLSAADPASSDAHTLLLVLAVLASDSQQQRLAVVRLKNVSHRPSRAALNLLEQAISLVEPGASASP